MTDDGKCCWAEHTLPYLPCFKSGRGSLSYTGLVMSSPTFCNLYSSLLTHRVGKTHLIFPPCGLWLGLWGGLHTISSICCNLKVSEWPALPWPGSMLSRSWCCVSETPLPSSCQTPRSSGNSWAATRRKQTGTAPATQLAAGLDERSSGLTVRRFSSCTTSWGATSTPLPQTWSTWWDMSHYSNH